MIQYIPFLAVAWANASAIPKVNMVDQYNVFGYNSSVTTRSILDSINGYPNDYSFNISNSNDFFTFDDLSSATDYKFEILVSTQPVSNNITFNSDVTNLDYYIDNSYVVLYDELNYNIDYKFYDEYYIYYDISFKVPNLSNLLWNYQTLYFYWSIYTSSSGGFGNYIEGSTASEWTISVTNYSMGVEYDNGYSNGYNVGSIDGYDLGYSDGYNKRQSTIDEMQEEINNLQDLVNDYRSGNISLESLMWTIASLPFESFKQIWNVNLLGVNLGGFALSLMFVGIVLFIWKKFI